MKNILNIFFKITISQEHCIKHATLCTELCLLNKSAIKLYIVITTKFRGFMWNTLCNDHEDRYPRNFNTTPSTPDLDMQLPTAGDQAVHAGKYRTGCGPDICGPQKFA